MYVRVAGSGSSGNSYVLHLDDGSWILLDMGCPYPAIQRAAEYKAPSKCLFGLVTHEHKDHCWGLGEFYIQCSRYYIIGVG